MFELVVGEIDAILGEMDESNDFAELAFSAWAATTAAARAAAFDALGERLLDARRQYEVVRGGVCRGVIVMTESSIHFRDLTLRLLEREGALTEKLAPEGLQAVLPAALQTSFSAIPPCRMKNEKVSSNWRSIWRTAAWLRGLWKSCSPRQWPKPTRQFLPPPRSYRRTGRRRN